MHGLLTTTKRMQCFALRVVGGGVPPVRLESGEIMRSRPMKAGLVKSLWRTSKLFSLLARLAS